MEGEDARFVQKGDPLHQGDVISTSARGFAVIALRDGTKITLRPSTTFAIEKFSHGASEESALFRLLRGGMRAFTGLISKRNPQGMQVTSRTATMGIRGTSFDARQCEGDCAEELKTQRGKPPAIPVQIVARIASIQGGAEWAKAGVMIRESLTAGSRHAFALVSRDQRQMVMGREQVRLQTNALPQMFGGFVQGASSAALGEGLAKIDESIPMNPPSVYAATKASCEFLGRAYAKRYEFEFICLRYVGGLYGPSPTALKATREQAIQQMIRAAVKGEATKVNWPYAPTEVLYGKDAAKGTVLAVLKDKFKDQLFHIGNGQLVGGEEILAAVKRHFPDAKVELARGGKPMPYPETRLASDFSRSKEQLGYEPDYPINKAVQDYAATLKRLENL